MPKIAYVVRKMGQDTMDIIDQANTIIEEYALQGFVLTLRQLYYQFVSRGILPNTMKSYKRLGDIINNGRLAGLIDWESIEDRTRNVVTPATWKSPKQIIMACAQQYRIDKWANQPFRPEVYIEKEALAGVVDGICRELSISYLSCRGYTSQSEMWKSAQRLDWMIKNEQTPIIIHLGDHDPSGIDMTRDIEDRLTMFMGGIELKRIALNMDQIEEYNPPPNPAKVTDSRFSDYEAKFGSESWELDALDPATIVSLIRETVVSYRDEKKWQASVALEERDIDRLRTIADEL